MNRYEVRYTSRYASGAEQSIIVRAHSEDAARKTVENIDDCIQVIEVFVIVSA